MKICIKCNIEKELEEFYKDKQNKDGLCSKCKGCSEEYKKKYRKENVEEIKQRNKKYYEENVEKIRKQKKEYHKENKSKRNEYQKKYLRKRRKNDSQFRMAHNLRGVTNRGIISQGGIKSASTEKLLGCSFYEASIHIKNLFAEGMCWENYGEWEIDHIRPMASFDLTDPEQQKICFHYTNLQPLWMAENRSKSSWHNGIRYNKKENIVV